MGHRILVTGSRSWTRYRTIADALYDAMRDVPDWSTVRIVHGDAHGADQLADLAARMWGATPQPHPAHWSAPCRPTCPPGHRRTRADGTQFCPAAGTDRNQHMVDLGANLCLAFIHNRSRGASDCVRRAREAGIPVRLFEHMEAPPVRTPRNRRPG